MRDTNICFPSDPVSPREVDHEYAEDAKAFAKLGAGILVWPMDEPGARVQAAKGFTAHADAPVAWRGWMLDRDNYKAWMNALGNRTARFDLAQYEMHHRMRNWVPAVQGATPKTWFVASAQQAAADMFPCHVKDGVKSANAAHLPRPCRSVKDIELHEAELKRQRGKLDDGLVLREHVDAFEPETRVWVMGPTINDFYYHACSVGAPAPSVEWLHGVLANADPAFFDAPFTMDIARKKSGEYFVMDMGDAGVSDYKEGHTSPVFLDFLRKAWYDRLGNSAPKVELGENPAP